MTPAGAVVYPPALESSAPFARMPVVFMGSFPDPGVRLATVMPEFALIGRSNVGKSSLLNALFGRRLARVSHTPGRTALLNVFQLPDFYLLDLPGYGYARTGQAERDRYRRLITGVLDRRRNLRGILWLLDLRHEPSVDDCLIGERLAGSGLPVLAALTKADKLPYARRQRRRAELTAALALPEDQVQLTSSVTGEGIADLAASLLAASRGRSPA